jgi:hypothetical protein
MKKQIVKIDFDNFQNDLTFTLAKTKLLELEWVNAEMIQMIFQEGQPLNKVIENLRDKIYNRIDGYKKILTKTGVKDETFQKTADEITGTPGTIN